MLVGCGLLGPAIGAGMIKLQFGCLPEGTLVDTPQGAVPVECLKAGSKVIGYDGTEVIVRQLHQYQEDVSQTRHLTVEFQGGAKVSLSPKHRIGGIPACELRPGDRVAGRVVSRIVPLGGVLRSFDLLTDDAGYQIQGIPVNSMIGEMSEARNSRGRF